MKIFDNLPEKYKQFVKHDLRDYPWTISSTRNFLKLTFYELSAIRETILIDLRQSSIELLPLLSYKHPSLLAFPQDDVLFYFTRSNFLGFTDANKRHGEFYDLSAFSEKVSDNFCYILTRIHENSCDNPVKVRTVQIVDKSIIGTIGVKYNTDKEGGFVMDTGGELDECWYVTIPRGTNLIELVYKRNDGPHKTVLSFSTDEVVWSKVHTQPYKSDVNRGAVVFTFRTENQIQHFNLTNFLGIYDQNVDTGWKDSESYSEDVGINLQVFLTCLYSSKDDVVEFHATPTEIYTFNSFDQIPLTCGLRTKPSEGFYLQ